MEFWDDKAAPSILLAVKSACEAMRGDLVTELQARDQNRHTFLTEEVSRLKDAAAKVNCLEIENRQLHHDLETLRAERAFHICAPSIEGAGGTGVSRVSSVEPAPDSSHFLARRQVLGEASPNAGGTDPNTSPGLDYATLAKKYASLLNRFESKQQASRKLKERTRQWIKYAESKDSKIRKLEKKLHSLGASREPEANATRKPTALLENEFDNIASDPSFRSSSEVHGHDKGPENDVDQPGQVSRAATTPAASAVPEPSPPEPEADASDVERESTEPQAEEDLVLPPLLNTANLSLQDMEIKPEPSSDGPVVVSERIIRKRRHVDEDDMPPPRTRIKKEVTSLSSDPVFTEEHVSFLPHESLDLDEGHDGLPTPRKQRFLGVETFQDVTVTRESDLANGSRTETVERLASATSNMASRRVERAGMRAAEVPSAARTPRIEYGVAAVAEDDSSFSRPPSPIRKPLLEVPEQTARPGRLQALMRKKDTEAVPVLSRQSLQMTRNLARPNPMETGLDLMALQLENRERRSILTPNRVPLAPKANHTMPNMRLPKEKDNVQKKTTRLRLLPPEKLGLEDFKINPKFNNGYRHAFDEVVRDRAGRAELAGCVDPNCCGKQFRAMAQSELDHGGPEILAREADIALVDEFMGEDAYRVMGMALDERMEIWLKAKTRDLANRYGRCRHRVARRPSPPGFWNPDFPNTQEVQENRQEAEKIERRMVEERWQEAKRGGGRWLFRDE